MADQSDPLLRKLQQYFAAQQALHGDSVRAAISHPDEAAERQPCDISAYRQAAVLIPLIPPVGNDQSNVLFTVRTENLRTHAGQVSFPGGTVDDSDEDAIHTALRESEEEVGLDPASVQVLGQLGRILLPSGFCVTPVVGLVAPGTVFRPSPVEVAGIFHAPSSLVLNPANYQMREMEWQNRQRRFLELQFQQYRIWGATARILHYLGTELAGVPDPSPQAR